MICDLFDTVGRHIETLRPRGAAEEVTQPDSEPTQSDEAVLASLLRDPALAALHGGDLSAYGGDHSRGEQALANGVAVRSRDRAQTKRIMLAVPLCQRKKTQQRSDYLDRTVEKAFDFPPKPEPVDFSNLKHNGERVRIGVGAQPETSTPNSKQPAYADASTWDDEGPSPRLWAGDNIFPLGHASYVFGHGGGFKTLLTQQLGSSVATGKRLLGKALIEGIACLYNCEDELSESHRRQLPINRHYKAKPVAGRLHFRSLVGCVGNEVATWNGDGEMVLSQTFHHLKSDLHYFKPKVVVLDNLAHFFGGNENIRSHAAGFCSLLEGLAAETGTAIIVIGHYNKDGKISGSTGWLNHVRHVVEVREVPNEPSKRQIWIEKSNYGRSKYVWAEFRYHNGVLVTDDELPPGVAVELAANEQAHSDARLFLDCLAERTRQKRAVSELVSKTYAPTVFARMAESRGIGKFRLEAAMDRLFKKDAIERGFLWRDTAEGKDRHGLREKPANGPANNPLIGSANDRELLTPTTANGPLTHPYIIDIDGESQEGSLPIIEESQEEALPEHPKTVGNSVNERMNGEINADIKPK